MTIAAVLSDDAFLGGSLRLLQPERGFRSGIDSVLLAAAIAAQPGEVALEAGSGAGTVSLCLAKRVGDLRVLGLERDPGLCALATQNAQRNALGARAEFYEGTVSNPPEAIKRIAADHVFANPPFFEEGTSQAAHDPHRAKARQGTEGTLAAFLDFCIRRSGTQGTVTVIHRAESLDSILQTCTGRLGAICIFPLWPRRGDPAKLVLVQGRKGSRAPLRMAPGLVLHQSDGRYTAEAEAILRHGAPLLMT